MLTSYNRKTWEPIRGLEGKDYGRSTNDPRFHCATLISNRENPQAPSFRIWTCRFRGVRNSPTSGMIGVKWRAGTSTHVLINPNQKHALKTVSGAYTPEHERGTSNEIYRSDKTNCMGSVDRFMRLIPWGDNPNKKILIYISYTSCLHRLSKHSLSCP